MTPWLTDSLRLVRGVKGPWRSLQKTKSDSVLALELAQGSHLVAFQGMDGGVSIFQAIDVQLAPVEVDLVPAQVEGEARWEVPPGFRV